MRQDCCKELIAVDDRSYRWLPSFVGALIKRDKNRIAVDDRSYRWLPSFVGALIKRDKNTIAVDDRSYRVVTVIVGALIKRDEYPRQSRSRSMTAPTGWLPLFVGALIKREPHGIKHNSAPSPSGRGLG